MMRACLKIRASGKLAHILLASAGATALLAPGFAQAQEVSEIVVTAQKREQSIQDVGISVTAFSGDQIADLGFTNTVDIAQMTAGVTISGSSAGQNAQFSIRGVTQNDFVDIVEGPTAVYLDEGLVIQQNAGTFGLFDIERVEILKGPQGTLFGRNATGGLVHFISKKPTRDFEGYADLTYGRFNSVNVQSAISGPLGDRVRARLAVFYNHQDPILHNTFNEYRGAGEIRTAGEIDPAFSTTPVAGGGQDHWNNETYAGRLSLEADLSDSLTLNLMGHGSRVEEGANSYQQKVSLEVLDPSGNLINTIYGNSSTTCLRVNVAGACVNTSGALDPTAVRPVTGGDFWGYVDRDGRGRQVSKDFAFRDGSVLQMYGANAKLTWDRDDFRVVAISDYKFFDRALTDDVAASPADTITASTSSRTNSFTQELRIEGDSDHLNWIAGAYYLYAKTTADNGFIISPSSLFALAVGAPVDAVNEVALKTNSYSAFGQVEFALTDRLNLTIGGRITRENKDFFLNQTFFTNGDDRRRLNKDVVVAQAPDYLGDPTPDDGVSISQGDTLWSGKIGLDYKPAEDLLFYASASRGVKSGAFNAPLPLFFPGGIAYDDLYYGPETLWAYEAGFKSTILGGSTRLNGAVFYYDYQNYQAFRFVGVAGIVTNKDADTVGAELEFATSPVKGLDIMLNGSWFDATVSGIVVGSPLPRKVQSTFAPKYQLSGMIRYQWPIGNGTASVMLDGMYKSGFYDNLSNFDASRHPAQKRFNLRANYTLPGDMTTLGFAIENITKEYNETIGFDLSGFCGCSVVGYDKPRWWSVNVRQKF